MHKFCNYTSIPHVVSIHILGGLFPEEKQSVKHPKTANHHLIDFWTNNTNTTENTQ